MSHIAFALDVPDEHEAQRYVDMLEDHVAAFKVGLELFTASGRLPRTKKPLILDLKLHDIPNTVAQTIKAGAARGATHMTLHIQQQDTLEAAVEAATQEDVTLLGVTVLTSTGSHDFEDLRWQDEPLKTRVQELAIFGWDCGIRGFVCSPQEVKDITSLFSSAFLLVPGVRPKGSSINDQLRVGTPKQAVEDGASWIVVGRPIRLAKDPVAAAQSINQEIGGL